MLNFQHVCQTLSLHPRHPPTTPFEYQYWPKMTNGLKLTFSSHTDSFHFHFFYPVGISSANILNREAPMKVTKNGKGERPNKCSQCPFTSSQASNLRRHLKAHRGEKLHKCNQCDFASSQASDLRTHLKIHSGEKSKKCNQCNFASSHASALKLHLKIHNGKRSKNQANATSVILHPLIQAP